MKFVAFSSLGLVLGLAAVGCGSQGLDEVSASSTSPLTATQMTEPQKNESGSAQTATSAGTIDTGNEFFASLGTNGRTCNSCHVAEQGWSITPAGLQARFDATDGLDPIFRPHDGANAPSAAVATVEERRAAYSLMLSRGVVRVGLPSRPTHEFTLVAADDPYGHASATQLSLFRRPLPTTNLRFTAALNWDGRNTPDQTNMRPGLKNQSNGATTGHAQGAVLSDDIRNSIVDFEVGLTTAQIKHSSAGRLDAADARGGPAALLTQPFAIGMNSGESFSPKIFDIFDAWNNAGDNGGINKVRADVAAGQRVFNEKAFGTGRTCGGCHNAPNVGSSTRFAFFDVGVSAPARRKADVPLYTFENKTTGERITTTDPGRALISGRWADMNKFKVPGLRGLAGRAPYFHDGSVATISGIVDHYEQRFGIQFNGDEKRQLVVFLESL